MELTELAPDLWQEEAIPTEYSAFKLLRDNPLATNVYYLAAPWSVLLNTRRRFFDTKLNLNIENGFTICQHISYAQIMPYLKSHGITTLFTPHALTHTDMTVLPFPHHPVNGVEPSNKDLLCSFVGCLVTHRVRSMMWNARPRSRDVKLIARRAWHYELSDRARNQNEYRNILARSRYSLCPRGTGASTIRFWESLQAGAIPVLLSDAMKLPDRWDWNKTILRIAESEVAKWPRTIRDVPQNTESAMRKNCLAAHAHFSGENLVSNVRLFFNAEDVSAVG